MQAIILAGGIGSRLHPLTKEMPKPMISVLNKPLMEYSIDLLKKHGITDIGVTVRYLPQYIKNYFSSGEKLNVNITYFEEDIPLGTAGSVKLAENGLDDTFIVISGDGLTNVDITKILKYHSAINADVTIVVKEQEKPLDYGVVLTDVAGRVSSFKEKPLWESVVSNKVNTGIYVINKKVLSEIPLNVEFDFSKDLFPMLLKENYRIFAYNTEDYWSDLGTPQSYLQANKDILNGKVFGQRYENVIEENVTLSESTKLIPPVYIGKNTIINGTNTIGPNVIIGLNNMIENCAIKNTVIGLNVTVNNTNLNESIIYDKSNLDRCLLAGNNVIGTNVSIRKNAHIKYGVKIYNNVDIIENSIISDDCKELKKARIIWGNNGIAGIWNHDILPSTLIGIASSFNDEKIIVCSNKTLLGSTIANLIASYFCLCGSNVYISASNESSCRFFSSTYKIKGVYIYENNENINIQLIDKNGLNIDHSTEKSIDLDNNNFSLNRGRIIRLNSIDKDFEYFLNASIPFSQTNVNIYAEEKYRLHNLLWDNNPDVRLSDLSSGKILAKNGIITDVYDKSTRLSVAEFLRLKIDIIRFLNGKKIFLPAYTPDDVMSYAKDAGLEVLRLYQHKGNTMQQTDSFNSIEILLEYVPSFFAQAYAFYLSKNKINKNQNTLITRYDFEVEPKNSCRTIFSLNKTSDGEFIRAKYKNAMITILPHNNGYSFSAYANFAKEEYSPDIVEEFISSNI